MIIERYLRNTFLKTGAAITLVLLLIAMSNKFVSLIGRAATGDLPGTLLFQMVALHIPEFLAMLMPLGLFLGIVLSLGRLYATNEMVAMLANGVTWRVVVKVGLQIGVGLTLITAILTLWSVPKFNRFKEELIAQHESAHLVQTMSPGRFHSLKNGSLVFYVENLSAGKRNLQEVFIAEQPLDASQAWSVLTAERGQIEKDAQGHRYLVLTNGTRYEGKPGSNDYSVVEYESYGRLIEQKPQDVPMFNRVTPTVDLLSSGTPNHRAELQWRLAIPLSVTVLVLMAIGLSYVPPRAGRYAKVVPAILAYILYYNFLTIAKRWVESDRIVHWIGVWWVHLVALTIAVLWVMHHAGLLSKWHYQLKSKRTTSSHETN